MVAPPAAVSLPWDAVKIMRLVDPDHPFFAKTWIRWFWTLLALGTAALEFTMGSPGWGLLFLAAGAYLGWELLIRK
jgi:hypothetical protein